MSPDLAAPPPLSRRITTLLASALALILALLFSPIRNASFVSLDDDLYITGNTHITTGLSAENLAWDFSLNNPAGFWIPLTWISLQIDASLSHNQMEPPATAPRLTDAPPPLPVATIYHLHNVLLHIIAAILLFLALQHATRWRYAAFAAVLLWAIHPLRVESVAWVTERKDVLAATFGFLTLYLYTRAINAPLKSRTRIWSFVICHVSFTLSLMAKPLFVTLPALLLLLDFWPLRRIHFRQDLLRRALQKLPLFALSVAFSLLAVSTQRQIHAAPSLAELPLSTRLAHIAPAYLNYLVAQFRIAPLAVGYTYGSPSTTSELLSIALLLALTTCAIWQRKARPWFFVGWFWFLIALLPMIGIVQSGEQGWADRFSYLPSVGLFLIAAGAAHELWSRFRPARPLLLAATSALAITLACFTLLQLTYWKNTITLFSHAVIVNPDNNQLHGLLGTALVADGQNDAAIRELQKAVDVNPTFPAWLALGYLQLELHHYREAQSALQKAAQLNPHDSRTRRLYAQSLEANGYKKEALFEYQAALHFNPNDPIAPQKIQQLQSTTTPTTTP